MHTGAVLMESFLYVCVIIWDARISSLTQCQHSIVQKRCTNEQTRQSDRMYYMPDEISRGLELQRLPTTQAT